MSEPKYDKETLAQLRDIKIEKRLKDLEDDKTFQQHADILGLTDRINTLEHARTQQIKLNTGLRDDLARYWSKERQKHSFLSKLFKR